MPLKPASKAGQTLSRSQRLIRSSEFFTLKSSGRRDALGCILANWMVLKDENADSRLGVVTSRKIGNAVHRARARRLLREVFRRNRQWLKEPLDLALIARRSIRGKRYEEVQRDFIRLCRKNGLMDRHAAKK